jgi:hypothetical protein
MMVALRNIIINHLRRIGYRNVNRKEVEAQSRKSRGNYECAKCLQLFKREEIHLDHIEPVVDPELGFTDWDTYITRLFLGKLQPLCLACHHEKSNQENVIRRSRAK